MARVAVLAGVGAWVPATVVRNDELMPPAGLDPDWIRARAGIEQRHMLGAGEATSDLAVEAGRRALDSARTATADAVVLATNTPDQLSPATAPEVAARLGLGPVAAFDVGAVCSGFVYALACAAGLIATGTAGSVLVIGADAYSTVLDPADLATRAIFGDGAGAVLLRAGAAAEWGALTGLSLGSDGARRSLIEIPGGGSRQRSLGLPVKQDDTYLRMRGRAVFAQAVQRMTESARRTTAQAGWSIDAVDRWVLHQANARILAAIARDLQVPLSRFVSNIAQVGNTVAASVPLALAAGVETGELRPGDRVVLAAFGGGLTWGSVGLVWPELPRLRDTAPATSAPARSAPADPMPPISPEASGGRA